MFVAFLNILILNISFFFIFGDLFGLRKIAYFGPEASLKQFFVEIFSFLEFSAKKCIFCVFTKSNKNVYPHVMQVLKDFTCNFGFLHIVLFSCVMNDLR